MSCGTFLCSRSWNHDTTEASVLAENVSTRSPSCCGVLWNRRQRRPTRRPADSNRKASLRFRRYDSICASRRRLASLIPCSLSSQRSILGTRGNSLRCALVSTPGGKRAKMLILKLRPTVRIYGSSIVVSLSFFFPRCKRSIDRV